MFATWWGRSLPRLVLGRHGFTIMKLVNSRYRGSSKRQCILVALSMVRQSVGQKLLFLIPGYMFDWVPQTYFSNIWKMKRRSLKVALIDGPFFLTPFYLDRVTRKGLSDTYGRAITPPSPNLFFPLWLQAKAAATLFGTLDITRSRL